MEPSESKSEEILAPSTPGEAGVSVDPIRILRKHLLLLIFSGFLGFGVGGVSYVALSIFPPSTDLKLCLKYVLGSKMPQRLVPPKSWTTTTSNAEPTLNSPG